MKKIQFLCYAIVAVSLICGCKKESPEVKKDFSKLFYDGKIKADRLLKANPELTEKLSSLNPTKLASQNSATQVKSAEMAGYSGQLYRTETYFHSKGSYQLQKITYYYYDNKSRLVEKVILNDIYLTGNFSLGGVWVYAYDINGLYSDYVDRIFCYDQNCNFIKSYEYQYVNKYGNKSAEPLSGILEFDNAHNLLANIYVMYWSGLIACIATYSPDWTFFIAQTLYTSNGSKVVRIENIDVNSYTLSYTDLSYTNEQLTYAAAAGKYNAETFTYLYYNPDLVCLTNLKSDGTFSQATVYRYDQSLDGEYFDPLNPVELTLLPF